MAAHDAGAGLEASGGVKEPLLDGEEAGDASSSSSASSNDSKRSHSSSRSGLSAATCGSSSSSGRGDKLGYVATMRRFGLLLFAACATLFVSTTLMSAVLPILPERLERLEAGPHVKGAVFSAFPFAVLLLSPFVPYVCNIFGKMPVLSAGILGEGSLEILFGYVEDICGPHRRRLSLWLYVLIRLLQGCGEAAITVPMTNLLCERCPSIMGFAIGLQEALAGVGFAVGPMAGGLLYAYGGWHVPFVTLGIATLATFPLIMLALQHYKAPTTNDDEQEVAEDYGDEPLSAGPEEQEPLNDDDRAVSDNAYTNMPAATVADEALTKNDTLGHSRLGDALQGGTEVHATMNGEADGLLPRQRRSEKAESSSSSRKSSSQRRSSSETPPYEYTMPPTRMLVNFVTADAALITIVCAIAFGYIEPNIAQHISAELGVGTKEASAMYSLIPAAYSAISIFGGPLADKVIGYRGMLIWGVVLLIIAHLLLGPVPLLHIKEGSAMMWIVQPMSYVLLGIGASASFIPSLPYMQSGVSHLGEAAREAVTGPFNSIYYMGETLGPLIGSYFCDRYGMKVGMTLPAAACAVCLGASALLMLVEKRRKARKRKRQSMSRKARERDRERDKERQTSSGASAAQQLPSSGGATAPAENMAPYANEHYKPD